jgi:hypothetical protein
MNYAHNPSNEQARAAPLIPAAPTLPVTRDPYRGYGGYAGTGADGPGESGFDLLHYWRIVNKRKWLILGLTGAFVVLGAVRTLMQTPLYTSTVRLQIDRNVAKVVEGGNVTPVDGSEFEFLRHRLSSLETRPISSSRESFPSLVPSLASSGHLHPRLAKTWTRRLWSGRQPASYWAIVRCAQ